MSKEERKLKKSIVLYGSTTGATKEVAETIAEALQIPAVDVAQCDVRDLGSYEVLLLGSSTWGSGELQDDWATFLPAFEKLSLKGKKVALFGTGDQEGFSDTFVEALGVLYDAVIRAGAEVIGSCPVDGYTGRSLAVRNGSFVGLPLDDDNQPEATAERVKGWIDRLRTEL
jgi:flavodoxin I